MKRLSIYMLAAGMADDLAKDAGRQSDVYEFRELFIGGSLTL